MLENCIDTFNLFNLFIKKLCIKLFFIYELIVFVFPVNTRPLPIAHWYLFLYWSIYWHISTKIETPSPNLHPKGGSFVGVLMINLTRFYEHRFTGVFDGDTISESTREYGESSWFTLHSFCVILINKINKIQSCVMCSGHKTDGHGRTSRVI